MLLAWCIISSFVFPTPFHLVERPNNGRIGQLIPFSLAFNHPLLQEKPLFILENLQADHLLINLSVMSVHRLIIETFSL